MALQRAVTKRSFNGSYFQAAVRNLFLFHQREGNTEEGKGSALERGMFKRAIRGSGPQGCDYMLPCQLCKQLTATFRVQVAFFC